MMNEPLFADLGRFVHLRKATAPDCGRKQLIISDLFRNLDKTEEYRYMFFRIQGNYVP